MKKILLTITCILIMASSSYAQFQENTDSKYRLNALAGLCYGNISMNFANVENVSLLGARIGFEGEYILPFNQNKWSLITGLELSMLRKSNSPQSNNRLLTIGYSAIEIPIGIRHYFFLTDTNSLFINAFYKVNLLLDKEGAIDFEPNFGIDDIDHTKGGQNFAWGIGYKMKKISIEARMESNQNILKDYAFYKTKISKVSLSISYNLSK